MDNLGNVKMKEIIMAIRNKPIKINMVNDNLSRDKIVLNLSTGVDIVRVQNELDIEFKDNGMRAYIDYEKRSKYDIKQLCLYYYQLNWLKDLNLSIVFINENGKEVVKEVYEHSLLLNTMGVESELRIKSVNGLWEILFQGSCIFIRNKIFDSKTVEI